MKKLIILFLLFCFPIFIVHEACWRYMDEYVVLFVPGAFGLSLLIYGLYLLFSNKFYLLAVIILSLIFLLIDLLDAACFYKMQIPLNPIFLQHLNLNSLKFASGKDILYLIGTIFIETILFTLFIKIIIHHDKDIKDTAVAIKISILIVGVFCIFKFSSPVKDSFSLLERMYFRNKLTICTDKMFKEAGVKTCAIDYDSLKVEKGKNLIFIYLESFEAAFTNEKIFPDLTPNINKLKKEAIVFDNIQPACYATYSFGGVYSSMTGSHLVTDQFLDLLNTNNGIDLKLGNKLLSVPEILNKAAYQQIFIYGGDIKIGYLDKFVEHEKFDKIIQPQGNDKNRECYDDELFNAAYEELEKLNLRQPFNVTIFTLDTHDPGRVDSSWPEYNYKQVKGLNKYDPVLTAINHTDKALGIFINKLKQSSIWGNTIIFIINDHYTWPINSSPVLEKNNRTMLVMVLNTGKSEIIKIPGKTFDAAPTVLDLMGVKYNYTFPLGESLLSSDHLKERLNDDSILQEEALTYYLKLKSEDNEEFRKLGK